MAATDWKPMAGSARSSRISYGVFNNAEPPPGYTGKVLGFNSLPAIDTGCIALRADSEDFAPMASGGSILGCIRRGEFYDGVLGYTPFFFLGAQDRSIQAEAYILSLSDEDYPRVLLRRGSIATLGEDGALLDSTPPILTDGTPWRHLRLDVSLGIIGRSMLMAYTNDLDLPAYDVGHPNWKLIMACDEEAPLVGGYAGFGFHAEVPGRQSFFAHVEIFRQVYP